MSSNLHHTYLWTIYPICATLARLCHRCRSRFNCHANWSRTLRSLASSHHCYHKLQPILFRLRQCTMARIDNIAMKKFSDLWCIQRDCSELSFSYILGGRYVWLNFESFFHNCCTKYDSATALRVRTTSKINEKNSAKLSIRAIVQHSEVSWHAAIQQQ